MGQEKKTAHHGGPWWLDTWLTISLNSFYIIKRMKEEYHFQVFVLSDRVAQYDGVTALMHQQFSHFKHKCGGRRDVLVRDRCECPAIAGWMGHNILPCEQAGLLFKSSGQSPSMCTSLLRHGEQRDACREPLLAYCRGGLLRPLGWLIKSQIITYVRLTGREECKINTRRPILLLLQCS